MAIILLFSASMTSLASRYHHTVDVILEEGSSDDDDFIEQEARLRAQEDEEHEQQRQRAGTQDIKLPNGSRPPFCAEGQEQNAYGEAVAILDQASSAFDQEFADQMGDQGDEALNEYEIDDQPIKPSFRATDPR